MTYPYMFSTGKSKNSGIPDLRGFVDELFRLEIAQCGKL